MFRGRLLLRRFARGEQRSEASGNGEESGEGRCKLSLDGLDET